MRSLLTMILVSFFFTSFSQSFVYKKNLLSGNLEVFQSQNGLPIGSPVFILKKNVWGYIEIENVQTTVNPFTKKPDYSNHVFKLYQLPAKEILQTIEVLNNRNEYDNASKFLANGTSTDKIIEVMNNFNQSRVSAATELLKFYNSNSWFPQNIKDGWYEVVKIFEERGALEIGLQGGLDFRHGICYVLNNKVTEYYENCHVSQMKVGFVYQKIPIELSSSIKNCKASFRAKGSNSYQSLYFLDNILDESKQIDNPMFSYFSVFTHPDVFSYNDVFMITISRNGSFTRDDIINLNKAQYVAPLITPNVEYSDCKLPLSSASKIRVNDKSVC